MDKRRSSYNLRRERGSEKERAGRNGTASAQLLIIMISFPLSYPSDRKYGDCIHQIRKKKKKKCNLLMRFTNGRDVQTARQTAETASKRRRRRTRGLSLSLRSQQMMAGWASVCVCVCFCSYVNEDLTKSRRECEKKRDLQRSQETVEPIPLMPIPVPLYVPCPNWR